jgi:CspA family cold shock protein
MQEGTVVWFNDKKGFGYLKDKDQRLVFIHYSAIKSEKEYKTLSSGQPVKFSAQDELGTLRATLVIPRVNQNAK